MAGLMGHFTRREGPGSKFWICSIWVLIFEKAYIMFAVHCGGMYNVSS